MWGAAQPNIGADANRASRNAGTSRYGFTGPVGDHLADPCTDDAARG